LYQQEENSDILLPGILFWSTQVRSYSWILK